VPNSSLLNTAIVLRNIVLQTIIQDVGANPDAVVIWLHGLGDEGASFVSAIPYLQLPSSLQVRFVFPTAPVRSVTVNNGMAMRSWYDIKAMLPQRVIDDEQLKESVACVNAIIAEQVASGIQAERIIVVGFSQGGAVCYEVGLTSALALSGIAAMSTYMPRELSSGECLANRALNILTIHGEYDDVVPCALGRSALSQLQSLGFASAWHTFDMAHEVSVPSLILLGEWITNNLTGE